MDKRTDLKKDWAWVSTFMPGVAKLIAERRAQFGSAWVGRCWHESVVKRNPGWLFVREGTVAIGTPWDDPLLANFAAQSITAGQALVIIREPAHGEN